MGMGRRVGWLGFWWGVRLELGRGQMRGRGSVEVRASGVRGAGTNLVAWGNGAVGRGPGAFGAFGLGLRLA